MILDANTGAVLHADDADELRHPASLTKMMTLYLTFETILTGRLSMSDKIKISQEAASQAPSKLELEPGEEITVSDAVRALITKSANDVAVALAEKVGGSEKNFVRLMNTRARDLGMLKTNFENASGLPNNDQVTTARDMITLGLRLQDDFPNYYPLFATRAFSFNRGTYRNHNTMLNNIPGHRRHQDRLHQRIGIQPRIICAPGRPPCRWRGVRRIKCRAPATAKCATC